MPDVYVFDINGTLLDVSALDPFFASLFGETTTRELWFEQITQSALVSIVTNRDTDFGPLGWNSLCMLAERRQVSLPPEARRDLAMRLKHLPAHPDVLEALARLRGAGLRLATLTNSTCEVGEAQLANAGLRQYFERAFSADEVHRLKPAAEPYHYAAAQLHVSIWDIRMITAHAWDIAGALSAGCTAAFVARPGKVLDPLVPRPDIIGQTLTEVAECILDAHAQQ